MWSWTWWWWINGMLMRQRMNSVFWWLRMNEEGEMWCCYCSKHECELIYVDLWIMWWGRWERLEVCDVIKHCFRERGEKITIQVMKMRMWKRMNEGNPGNFGEWKGKWVWWEEWTNLMKSIQFCCLRDPVKWDGNDEDMGLSVIWKRDSLVRDEKRELGREVK